jgi:decaprenylphospho-beta-D-erythro-pentofuranosid-2-ulose 2-reductase
MKRIVITAATSAIAESAAHIWAKREPSEFFLIARDKDKLGRMASNLVLRNQGTVAHEIILDFSDPKAIAKVVKSIASDGPIDIALIAQGVLTLQRVAQENLDVLIDSIAINATSPAMFAECFLAEQEKQGFGQLGIIGSVAADRGRKELYTYGASKSFLETFVEGAGARLVGTKATLTIWKPGPTDTPMMKRVEGPKMLVASPDSVAKAGIRAMDKGKRKVYLPKRWWLVMFIARCIPNFIYDRLSV